jgi:uncharacterized membrane protein YjgN (DUF898 family)
MADTCPKCGQNGISSDKCPGCGVIIPLYESYLEKVRRGPQRPTTPAPPTVSRVTTATITQTYASPITAPSGMATTQVAPRPAGERHQPSFQGTGGGLWRVQIVTMFLTIITLGVYYPWAKTRLRQYMFGQTAFDGDRFAYHGTGKELFHGAFKASLIFGMPVSALNWIANFAGGGVISIVANALVGAMWALFVPLAIMGARRYRLSRTSWCGIRFSFRGDTKTFIKRFFLWSLLIGVTLGLYYPVFLARRHAFLTAHSYFGNARFGFDGRPRALFGPFLRIFAVAALAGAVTGALYVFAQPFAVVGALLGVVGVALAWAAFVAAKRRYFWNHTTLGDARFQCSVTAGSLTKLWIVNVLLLVVTVGIGAPWVRVRNTRYTCDHLTLEGDVDPAAIVQDARDAPPTGEALSGLLDADIEIG